MQQGGGSGLLSTTVTLSNAQLVTLGNSAVQLVPALGTGNVTVVLGVAFVYNFGTLTYYHLGGNPPNVIYGPTGDTVIISGLEDMVQGQTESIYEYAPGALLNFINSLADATNVPVILTGSNLDQGPIATASMTAGGLGYMIGDTGTITTGLGDATYQVTSIGAGGAVTGFMITNGGTVYATGAGQATATGGSQPGIGTNFTVNVTAIQSGDGTLTVTVLYQIISVS